MEVDVKALWNKELDGQTVGRVMLQDLAACYQNMLAGKGEQGFLSGDDKNRLVAKLTKPQDIRRYNELRYVHEYLVQLPLRYGMHEQHAEAVYWHIKHLMTMYKASRILIKSMTKRQLKTMNVLDTPAMVRQCEALLAEYTDALRQCRILHVVVKLIGEWVEVPELSVLLPPPDNEKPAMINYLITMTNCKLPMLDIAGLEPDAERIDKARKALTVDTLQGNMWQLYDLLMNGGVA